MLMNQHRPTGCRAGPAGRANSAGYPEVVIVDPQFQQHRELVRAAEDRRIRLHVCVNGQAAIRLAARLDVDAWFVAADLPDLDGIDLASMLVAQTRRGGHRRHGVYVVAARYRLDEEQEALAAGVTGYLADPAATALALENHGLRPRGCGKRPCFPRPGGP